MNHWKFEDWAVCGLLAAVVFLAFFGERLILSKLWTIEWDALSAAGTVAAVFAAIYIGNTQNRLARQRIVDATTVMASIAAPDLKHAQAAFGDIRSILREASQDRRLAGNEQILAAVTKISGERLGMSSVESMRDQLLNIEVEESLAIARAFAHAQEFSRLIQRINIDRGNFIFGLAEIHSAVRRMAIKAQIAINEAVEIVNTRARLPADSLSDGRAVVGDDDAAFVQSPERLA